MAKAIGYAGGHLTCFTRTFESPTAGQGVNVIFLLPVWHLTNGLSTEKDEHQSYHQLSVLRLLGTSVSGNSRSSHRRGSDEPPRSLEYRAF